MPAVRGGQVEVQDYEMSKVQYSSPSSSSSEGESTMSARELDLFVSSREQSTIYGQNPLEELAFAQGGHWTAHQTSTVPTINQLARVAPEPKGEQVHSFSDKNVSRSFALAPWLPSGFVALGKAGFVVEGRGVRNARGLPVGIATHLRGAGKSGYKVAVVAIGPNDTWFCQLQKISQPSQQSCHWSVSDEFDAAMAKNSNRQVSVVSLGPGGSFFVQFTDGHREMACLPTALQHCLLGKSRAPENRGMVKRLSLGEGGAWFALFQDGEWRVSDSLPAQVKKLVDTIRVTGGTLRLIEFGDDPATWLVRYLD
mmetsp:Transcript_18264/g.51159  ORF Transcript_18264/g.51159 Transcript_18264/m.51159 type:complete len:311 (-) Transcript_18264:504-1436(-)|eukprot:CAMPEP_0117657658 /NCGR_PEP_ID=MMETSP0804-20121206/5448_1 /TAXON_ID=1074897 /ORGANISM="Tetraselmis astigmatica, Strain CCMP880" /LENGTH=310 /DNA_ID=CAMNT_0005464127 /DNA_START=94 /DNA_END=1026 /DNA_ORIENTATION=+